jgi:iron complex transport system substrate-binding protein
MRSIEDVFDELLRTEAAEAVVDLRARYWTAVDYVNPYVDGPEIAFLEKADPVTVAGLWTPGLIEHAGGRHSLNRPGEPPRSVGPEELIETSPDRIIVAGDETLAEFRTTRWWKLLTAVQDGQVVVVDDDVFGRPGPRLVDGFRWLVSWINDRPEVRPDSFPVREAAASPPPA